MVHWCWCWCCWCWCCWCWCWWCWWGCCVCARAHACVCCCVLLLCVVVGAVGRLVWAEQYTALGHGPGLWAGAMDVPACHSCSCQPGAHVWPALADDSIGHRPRSCLSAAFRYHPSSTTEASVKALPIAESVIHWRSLVKHGASFALTVAQMWPQYALFFNYDPIFNYYKCSNKPGEVERRALTTAPALNLRPPQKIRNSQVMG